MVLPPCVPSRDFVISHASALLLNQCMFELANHLGFVLVWRYTRTAAPTHLEKTIAAAQHFRGYGLVRKACMGSGGPLAPHLHGAKLYFRTSASIFSDVYGCTEFRVCKWPLKESVYPTACLSRCLNICLEKAEMLSCTWVLPSLCEVLE